MLTDKKQKLPWVEAFNKASQTGRLATNQELDDAFSINPKGFSSGAVWASTVLVHPKENGVFKKGKDIHDPYAAGGKHMVFLEKDIPISAFGKQGVSLIVEPNTIEEKGDEIIVHPREVTILEESLQESGWGVLDAKTCLPKQVSEEKLKKIPEKDQRYLYRDSTQGVRPLVRGIYFNGRGVSTYVRFDLRFGVVVSDAIAGKNSATKNNFHPKTLAELEAEVAEIQKEYDEKRLRN